MSRKVNKMNQVCRFCGSSNPDSVNILESPSVMSNVEVCLARKVSHALVHITGDLFTDFVLSVGIRGG